MAIRQFSDKIVARSVSSGVSQFIRVRIGFLLLREWIERKEDRKMARGHQKIQSQAKAQKKAADSKKGGADQKAAAQKALVFTCTICKTQMPDPKTYKQHFESKHPKADLPDDLK